MKLNQLRDVVVIADTGSLHAAARQLRVTQPALTRGIRALESELGTTLFERHARGVSLTPTGQRLVLRAKAILAEVSRARDDVQQSGVGAQGSISVCLGLLPHLTLLPGALRAFRKKYPDVRIDMIEARFPGIEASLRSGIVDLFVGPHPGNIGREFTMETLYEQEIAILCRRGHPRANARSLRALVGAEWLTNAITAVPEMELGPLFAQHGLPTPRLVVQSRSGTTILAVVGSTDLLVLLPKDLVRTELGGSVLRQIHVAESIPGSSIVMICRTSLPLTPAAEYFADMLRREAVRFRRGRGAAANR